MKDRMRLIAKLRGVLIGCNTCKFYNNNLLGSNYCQKWELWQFIPLNQRIMIGPIEVVCKEWT